MKPNPNTQHAENQAAIAALKAYREALMCEDSNINDITSLCLELLNLIRANRGDIEEVLDQIVYQSAQRFDTNRVCCQDDDGDGEIYDAIRNITYMEVSE